VKIVLGSGPANSRLFLCGEGPGKVESQTGLPFSGPSGKKLQSYMDAAGLPSLSQVFKTNVIKEYTDQNPDPTPQQIADWTPTLLSELEEIKPQIILAIGRYAADWFLTSQSTDLDTMHGMPHYPLAPHLPDCIKDSIIIPLLHPAGALWNYERGSLIRYGYEMAGEWVSRLDRGLPIHYRYDGHRDGENYQDICGWELEALLNAPYNSRSIIGLDTEGTPERPWSIQLSLDPGSGLLLRCSQPDFQLGTQSIARYLQRNRPTIALHDASTPKCSCYDVVMCRAMGLELQGLPWFNTMYWAYLRRLEPQGNKPLCDRWQAMEMEDYESTIGLISKDKQIDYLTLALDFSLNLGKPDKRYIKENDGTTRVTQPKAIRTTIESIIQDVAEGKVTKEGPTDPQVRWEDLKDSNPQQTQEVEARFGPMPEASLDDVPLDRAIRYSLKDSDGTLRNALTFMDMLQ
jgi:uracil-DNA glycosylase family 4